MFGPTFVPPKIELKPGEIKLNTGMPEFIQIADAIETHREFNRNKKDQDVAKPKIISKIPAKRVAEAADADLFEIKPVDPYTDADLRWTNPLARCNREKIGKKDVPIANKVENFDQYDMIYIGFPVWYYAEPNIIDTFVKSYDFSGKKVALFATSGGSDIAKAPGKMQPLMKGEIVGARLFRADESFPVIKTWTNSL